MIAYYQQVQYLTFYKALMMSAFFFGHSRYQSIVTVFASAHLISMKEIISTIVFYIHHIPDVL